VEGRVHTFSFEKSASCLPAGRQLVDFSKENGEGANSLLALKHAHA
jgi:hypothetical protein